ncbi:Protein transport protein Sec61 subunit alpha [Geodia barretti]|nr:Protein transport protein Sec61 subunit alpha [Geodia barretti]
MLASHSDKFQALYKVLFRHNLPNLLNLTATVLVFATVIYLQGFRVELPIKSARYRGQCSKYSIKLLYTGITPVIIHRVLVLYLYQASQIFYLIFGGNLLVDLLGVWSTVEDTQPSRLFFLEYRSGYYPSSGLCYYLSAIGSHPGSVIIDEPIRAIIYGTFMLCTMCFHLQNID